MPTMYIKILKADDDNDVYIYMYAYIVDTFLDFFLLYIIM